MLCDIHHRLVDTVAKLDYPAHKLREIRRKFCEDSTAVLNTLAKAPMPAIVVCWPVGEEHFSVPDAKQINDSFSPMSARWSGDWLAVVEKDETLRTVDEQVKWDIYPEAISKASDRILMQSSADNFRAGLFATGPMPALIALGSKIGNKTEITPMLKHRDTGKWNWPSPTPTNNVILIDGLDELGSDESDITILLALTANPPAMHSAAEILGYKRLVITSSQGMGNGAIAHPKDGLHFRQQMQELLHKLQDRNNVKNIHLLPCASNAACVFLGQSIDNYHPLVTLYDFSESSMVKRLTVRHEDNKYVVETAAN